MKKVDLINSKRHSHLKAPSAPTSKREMILAAAMKLFAERGYHHARMDDLAADLGIAKGSIFQYFGNKERLFLEVYKQAARSFSSYLDVPQNVRQGGFFDVLRYWLVHTEHMVRENWTPYRIQLLGNYETDLALKKEINRFLVSEDPFGRVPFVQFGLSRAELRNDLDVELIVSFIDWVVERFQDALLVEELDPGLFRRHGVPRDGRQATIDQFIEVLRGAVGSKESR